MEESIRYRQFKNCIKYATLGDIIGYRNGVGEFNGLKNDFMISVINLYQFISNGGISVIPHKDWKASDDTILNLATCKALLKDYNSLEELYQFFAEEYIDAYEKEKENNREFGLKTIESINYIKNIDGQKWDILKYDKKSTGSGCSIRTMSIGLAFFGKDNRKKLVQVAIEAGRITHNNAIGYLGGVVTALFTAFAIEKIDPDKWVFKMLKILNSNYIDDYIKKSNGYNSYEQQYKDDKEYFIDMWEDYVHKRFKNKKFREDPRMSYPDHRSAFYNNNFALVKKRVFPGESGHDSVIIAYDCLLDSKHQLETLIIYSMYHVGDSDTTGSIAGSLFGMTFGLDLKASLYQNIEFSEEVINITDKLYKKYARE
jgi:ADP-ribosylarginine hydrolase